MALKAGRKTRPRVDPNQDGLFGDITPTEPSKKVVPFRSIYVHFDSHADMDAFSDLIGQKVDLTISRISFPEKKIA